MSQHVCIGQTLLRSFVAFITAALLYACGSGGAGVVPSSANAINPVSSSNSSSERSTASTATASPVGVTAFGSLIGSTWTQQSSGATLPVGAIVTVDFSSAVNPTSFQSNVQIVPAVTWSTYPQNYDTREELTIHALAGIKYTVTVPAGVELSSGVTTSVASTFTFVEGVATPSPSPTPSATPTPTPTPSPAALLTTNLTASPTPAPSASSFGVTAYGSLVGSTWTQQPSGATLPAGALVTVDFGSAVNPTSFDTSIQIVPAVTWSAYFVNYDKRAQLTIHEIAGTKYTLTVPAGVQASNGVTTTAPSTFVFVAGGATPKPTPSPTPTPTPTPSPPPNALLVTEYGGLKGTTFTQHASGSVYDYAEIVTIDFNAAVNTTSFNAHFSVTPSTAWTTYPVNYGKRIEITIRKTPGTTYTLALGSGVTSTAGNPMSAPQTFQFTTSSNVTVPSRISFSSQPYRYGFLVHPYSTSLAGPQATQIANLMQSEGAGFARIDYTGGQVMPTAKTTNFAPSDAIVAMLAARGITLLPILEQYNGASWQTNGQPYPAIYATPQLYASFVSTVVAHLRSVAPQVTRVELFNEPNLSGWWTSPTPQYAATDGSATAAYMLAGYAAAKAANPNITVVGPALSDGGTGAIDPRSFLSTMYANGCRTGKCWDVLSVHPYAWVDPTYAMDSTNPSRWGVYQDLQAIAVSNGDAKPHVMLTEWGYSTVDEATGFDPKVQARYMALGFNLALGDPTIDGIVWADVYAPGSDFWSRVSITDASFNLLPAAGTFRSFAVP